MKQFLGYGTFEIFVSDAGFVVFKQDPEMYQEEGTVIFPMDLWDKVDSAIRAMIAEADDAA